MRSPLPMRRPTTRSCWWPRIEGSYASVGVLATIEDRGALRSGAPALTIRATQRAQIGHGVMGTGSAVWVEATPIEAEPTDRTRGLAIAYRTTVEMLLDEIGGSRWMRTLPSVDEPSALADTIAYWPDLSIERRLELLETPSVDERLELATEWVDQARAELEVANKIRSDVSEGLEKEQREVLLRRQLAAIRAELGESDGDVVGEFRAKLDTIAPDLPEPCTPLSSARSTASNVRESRAKKVAGSGPGSTRCSKCPFGERSASDLDLGAARDRLDQDHAGLDEPKQRIIEHLAVAKLRSDREVEGRGGRRS